jgi:hypothetical protein
MKFLKHFWSMTKIGNRFPGPFTNVVCLPLNKILQQSQPEEVGPAICLVWMIPYTVQVKRRGILDESSLRAVTLDGTIYH